MQVVSEGDSMREMSKPTSRELRKLFKIPLKSLPDIIKYSEDNIYVNLICYSFFRV